MASTAGLSKDVIDLMEKKLVLLTSELSDARTRISALEVENGQLRAQLHNSQPVIGRLVEHMGVFWKRTA